jgi:Ni2+-binding GTPase involved in maturation of urease and hydrogenase
MTLFIIAMTDICKGIKEPTKMIGYADDCIIYTSHKLLRVAEARLKKAADKLMKMDLEYQPS